MSGRPRSQCRTDFEAGLLTHMAAASIDDYATLADKAGTTTTTIQRICSGARQPSIGTLQKLAKALGVTVDDLI